MKLATYYLLLLFILTVGCGEENDNGIQKIKDGEFVIQLYDSNGDLLLTRKGDAENLLRYDSYWEIRLLDPSFGLPDSEPLKTFASLTIFGQSPINTPKELHFNTDNTASFHQRWYSLEDDWSYKSVDGTLKIISLEKSGIKGYFEITLEVDANAHQNPLWGKYILAKGYFSSICPYKKHGGCP